MVANFPRALPPAWLFHTGKAEFLPLDHGDIKLIDRLPALDSRAVNVLDFSFSADKWFHAGRADFLDCRKHGE